MEEQENKTENSDIIPQEIEQEMKKSYLAYSMSVIIGRALPDVRDGLKPVHRRILYAMSELGMLHNKPFKKSARIVGEVLGKYHPHGDTAVYDSMVRMAQEFSLRYPLINGQGNFGSIDGDRAAAMRYTEARLQRLSEEILKDLDKDTVDFVENFDGSLKEPAYLPCKVPNLLINGSSGIAVGMATNIPPHNLSEVCDAMEVLIDNPECEVTDLMEHVKGPDFPTGGIITGSMGIKSAYAKGRGKVIVKAKTSIEETNGKKKIIVHEIPYMVNKSNLLQQIAENVRDKRIEGVSDLRDESDREGMRIVVELKQSANETVVLNQLFKHSRLQESFSMLMLSIVDKEPKVLGLKEMLSEFLKHRKLVVTRRTAYELQVAKDREHIVAGLVIALDHIDAVVEKIKKSANAQEASATLQADYSLSEKQAKAILEMRLQKLSSLEQKKLRDEQEELLKRIKELEFILANDSEILKIIKEELAEMKRLYGDGRRTDLEEGEIEDIEDEDLIKEETMVVTLTHAGYVKRVPLSTYRAQGRGGKGIIAATTKEEDFVEELFIASTHAYLLIFTDKGKVYWKKVYKLPESSRTAKGTPIINLIRTEKGEKVTTVIPIRHFEKGKYLVFATKNGTAKRTSLDNFARPRNGGIIALSLAENDELITVVPTDGKQQIVLATKNGRAVKFKETDLRVMGRSARGVRGIKVGSNDEVVGMVKARDENKLLTITNKGFGKQTIIEDYRLINRGGSGVINIKTTDKNGSVVAIKHITDGEDILLISKNGVAIRVNANDISTIGRNTQGVRVMRVKDGDQVMAVAKCPKEDVDDTDVEEAKAEETPTTPVADVEDESEPKKVSKQAAKETEPEIEDDDDDIEESIKKELEDVQETVDEPEEDSEDDEDEPEDFI